MVLKLRIRNGKKIKVKARSIGKSVMGAAKATVKGYKAYRAAAPQRQATQITRLRQDIKIQKLREQKEKLLKKKQSNGIFGSF